MTEPIDPLAARAAASLSTIQRTGAGLTPYPDLKDAVRRAIDS